MKKNIIVSTLTSLVVFLIFLFFFDAHSFHPYEISFKTKSKLDNHINANQIAPLLKTTHTSPTGGSLIIDAVIKNSDESILLQGRYYSEKEISTPLDPFLTQLMNTLVSAYFSATFCTLNLDLNKTDVLAQFKNLSLQKNTCNYIIQTELEKSIQVSDIKVVETNRSKKISFIAFVISVFFGGTVFLIIENFRTLKNAKV